MSGRWKIVTRLCIPGSISARRWKVETHAMCRHRAEKRTTRADRPGTTFRHRHNVSGPSVSGRSRSREPVTREPEQAIFQPGNEATCCLHSSCSTPASRGALHVRLELQAVTEDGKLPWEPLTSSVETSKKVQQEVPLDTSKSCHKLQKAPDLLLIPAVVSSTSAMKITSYL